MSEQLMKCRRVLVTGATSGIGRALAEALLKRGGAVAMVGREFGAVEALKQRYGERVHFLAYDLRDAAGFGGLAQEAHGAMGGLDGLVHGAGVFRHATLPEVSEEELVEQMEVNLMAPIRLTRAALPLMSDGGGVVFLSSTLGERPILTSPVYSATKGGLDAFMKAVAVEGAAKQVTSNALVLGMVDTPMVHQERPGQAKGVDQKLQEFAQLHLLGRLGDPAEVADVVIEVLKNSWMTGARVVLDGGLLMKEG
jgi:NAD(P)-dependent dehydrogenase (short-subunit alcohol dehydrogenase family)